MLGIWKKVPESDARRVGRTYSVHTLFQYLFMLLIWLTWKWMTDSSVAALLNTIWSLGGAEREQWLSRAKLSTMEFGHHMDWWPLPASLWVRPEIFSGVKFCQCWLFKSPSDGTVNGSSSSVYTHVKRSRTHVTDPVVRNINNINHNEHFWRADS